MGISDPSLQVDHADRDKKNNRRNNLRPCTLSQNQSNKLVHRNNKSGYKGVSLHSQSDKWRAIINHNKKKISLGLFFSKEEAAKAYDEAARRLQGEFARLNFPNEGENSAR